ncbi:MAG: uroporphyrinogen-III synthase [Steroidobacteraceae bacterium]
MTQPLAGLTVVVTRPARQATSFVERLLELGALAISFPTIEIEPVDLPADARDRLTPDRHDWAIYTSSNAVLHSLARLGQPTRARVAAIGRATARALAAAGVQVDAWPAQGADSEGLLAHPLLADVRGRKVLVVKGVGGRDALRDGLESRGATVDTAEVYRRVRATTTPEALAALGTGARHRTVVAVTSVEVLESLLDLAPDPVVRWLRDSTLLVPGSRVASAAGRLGWRGPVVVSASAEDDAMLDALARLGSGGTHA